MDYMSATSITASLHSLGIRKIPGRSSEKVAAKSPGRRRTVDRGYSYVVLFAVTFSFFCHTVVFNNGALVYQELLEIFGLSATATGWMVSLPGIVRLAGSPVVRLLSGRFEHRTIAIVGGVCYTAGVLFTAYATQPWVVYASYGMLAGFGMSMYILSSFIILAEYFDAMRGRAMGIAYAASGVGGAVFPPIISACFEKFGYLQTMVICSCIIAQLCVTGALFRPQPQAMFCEIDSVEDLSDSDPSHADSALNYTDSPSPNRTDSLTLKPSHSPIFKPTVSALLTTDTSGKATDSTVIPPNSIFISRDLAPSSTNPPKLNTKDAAFIQTDSPMSTNSSKLKPTDAAVNPTDSDLSPTDPTLPNHPDHKTPGPKPCCSDLSLLTNYEYLSYTLIMGSHLGLNFTGSVFITSLGEEVAGLSGQQKAMVLSIGSIGGLCAQFPSGFLFDLPVLRPYRTYLFSGISALVGVSCLSLAFCTDPISFIIAFTVFQLMSLGTHCQYVTILGDILSPLDLPGGIALCQLPMGFGYFGYSTVAGRFSDVLGSKALAFMCLGVFHTTLTLICTGVYSCLHRRTRQSGTK